ncbi:MAG TPA: trehalose-phosphatase [Marmoricola sp.]
MEGFTDAAARRYDEIARAGATLAVALDFDGTLAPIVEDPRTARIAPEAPGVLAELSTHIRALAVITGRPARQVLDLGGLDGLGAEMEQRESALFVFGQYGNERWSSDSPHVISPPPPPGLAGFLAELPRLLRESGTQPWVEEKGIAVALHTRALDDPQAAYDTLLPVIAAAAHEHGLRVEPGRYVIEVRGPGMDKGQALRRFVDEVGAGAVLYVGDDLGDLDAFATVEELREEGVPGLIVCARATESAIAEQADIVVTGPAGVLALLRQLTADLVRAHA